MVNFALTEDQTALKEECQKFGERQLQPIADERDRVASEDPEGPFPWDALKEFSSLGLKNLPLPKKWGGADMGVLTHCVLLEELMAAEAGFAAACSQGRDLGFDGKTLIHPKTLAMANEIFAPQPEELDFARRIIQAHGDAEAAGAGVVLLDGKLIEALHVVEAKRLLALAEAISARAKPDS